MCRNHKDIRSLVFRDKWTQTNLLNCRHTGQYFRSCDVDRLESRSVYFQGIFRIWLFFICYIQAILHRRCVKLNGFTLSGAIGCQFFQCVFRNTCIGNTDWRIWNRKRINRRSNLYLQIPPIRSLHGFQKSHSWYPQGFLYCQKHYM